MKMVYSLGGCKIHSFKIRSIRDIVEACLMVKEFRKQNMFIVKIGNR